MSELSKKSTVYFDLEIHHALRVKAASTHRSVAKDLRDISSSDIKRILKRINSLREDPRMMAV